MNRQLQIAVLSSAFTLLYVARVSTQVTLQLASVIPPLIAGRMKRNGTDAPQDRAKKQVHAEPSATSSPDVRFSQGGDLPDLKRAGCNEGQELTVTARLSSPPTLPVSSELRTIQAPAEAPVFDEPEVCLAAFDGTWNVSLTGGGFLCRNLPRLTLTVQNGSVHGGASGLSVSGQVEPSGSVSLTLRSAGIQGSASGNLLVASGSGVWKVPVLGYSGQWTARRT